MNNFGKQSDLPDQVVFGRQKPAFSRGFAASPTKGVAKTLKKSVKASSGIQHRFTSSTFFSEPVAKTALGASPKRDYLLIQNNGAVNVTIGFGTTPEVNGNNGVIIPPNAGITFENGIVPNNDVQVISSTSCRLTILEGIR